MAKVYEEIFILRRDVLGPRLDDSTYNYQGWVWTLSSLKYLRKPKYPRKTITKP